MLSLGADSDVTLTHVADTGVLLNSTSQIQFRDNALKINSSTDGQLDIDADVEVEITTGTVDLNGDLDVSGTSTLAGAVASGAITSSGIIKTDATTEATSTTDGSLQTDGGLSVVKDAVLGNDLKLLSDAAVLSLGADSDVTLTHDPDDGIELKSKATTDNEPVLLTLQTGETEIVLDDVLGTINFQAPDEGSDTDSRLVAAGIEAVSEGTFAADNNATKLSFKTGASEAATEKVAISSGGNLSLTASNTELRFYEGSNYVGFEAPSLSADQIWALPTADGSSNQVLQTDGDGTLSWGTVSATSIGTLSGASPLVLEGATANDYETTLAVTDPSADRTLTFPNVDGTFLTTGNMTSITTTGTITSGAWTGTAVADGYVADDLTISGGTVNNSVIGGSSAAAGSFTTITASTSLDVTGSAGIILQNDETITNTNDGTVLVTATTTSVSGDLTVTGNDITFGRGQSVSNPESGTVLINGIVKGGTGSGAGVFSSNGNYDVTLQTGNTTTGSITITDGSNGNIAITPNGSGEVDISKVDIDAGAIDNTAIGSATATTGAFTTITASTSLDVTGSAGIILENDETITNAANGTVLITAPTTAVSADLTLVDDESIILGDHSDIKITYDEATNDALEIAANVDGTGLELVLKADQGDDAGDEWSINVADGGVMTFGNDKASANTYVTHLTITPHATIASSSVAIAGDATVGDCLLYTSPSPRDRTRSRMPSSA